jgi:hypothetical protein
VAKRCASPSKKTEPRMTNLTVSTDDFDPPAYWPCAEPRAMACDRFRRAAFCRRSSPRIPRLFQCGSAFPALGSPAGHDCRSWGSGSTGPDEPVRQSPHPAAPHRSGASRSLADPRIPQRSARHRSSAAGVLPQSRRLPLDLRSISDRHQNSRGRVAPSEIPDSITALFAHGDSLAPADQVCSFFDPRGTRSRHVRRLPCRR